MPPPFTGLLRRLRKTCFEAYSSASVLKSGTVTTSESKTQTRNAANISMELYVCIRYPSSAELPHLSVLETSVEAGHSWASESEATRLHEFALQRTLQLSAIAICSL